ncbi:MAG: hypothetical protein M1559_03480 [Candidatus Marsarchaeota archaeon]|nr:hypothetical protein [Candidatus Marsarchaeota archaeon]
MMQRKPLYVLLAISLLLVGNISFAASNSSLNISSVVSQSYTPPKYLSAVIGIILIVVVIFIGFKFLKDAIKTILVLILLFILASVAYSFFTTGTLTLSGVSGLINGIVGFFKDIVGASHTVTSVINSTGKAVGAVSNATKALNKT